mgnify:CR=1 FL=1
MKKLVKCLIAPISGMVVGYTCLSEAYMYSGGTQYTKQQLIDDKVLAKKVERRHNTMRRFGVELKQ